jgi:hypothetical protein
VFTRILTQFERDAIHRYTKTDEKKDTSVRKIVYYATQSLPQIDADRELLRSLLKKYEKTAR